jgi:hypothetical protein
MGVARSWVFLPPGKSTRPILSATGLRAYSEMVVIMNELNRLKKLMLLIL